MFCFCFSLCCIIIKFTFIVKFNYKTNIIVKRRLMCSMHNNFWLWQFTANLSHDIETMACNHRHMLHNIERPWKEKDDDDLDILKSLALETRLIKAQQWLYKAHTKYSIHQRIWIYLSTSLFSVPNISRSHNWSKGKVVLKEF